MKNLEMAGIPNICVTSEDPEVLERNFSGFFDKCLLMHLVPERECSTGKPWMMEYWKERGPEAYVPIQKKLILQGAGIAARGRDAFIFHLHIFKERGRGSDGISAAEYAGYASEGDPSYEGFAEGAGLEKCVRIFPHRMPG